LRYGLGDALGDSEALGAGVAESAAGKVLKKPPPPKISGYAITAAIAIVATRTKRRGPRSFATARFGVNSCCSVLMPLILAGSSE
jgi:hypothetical protein